MHERRGMQVRDAAVPHLPVSTLMVVFLGKMVIRGPTPYRYVWSASNLPPLATNMRGKRSCGILLHSVCYLDRLHFVVALPRCRLLRE